MQECGSLCWQLRRQPKPRKLWRVQPGLIVPRPATVTSAMVVGPFPRFKRLHYAVPRIPLCRELLALRRRDLLGSGSGPTNGLIFGLYACRCRDCKTFHLMILTRKTVQHQSVPAFLSLDESHRQREHATEGDRSPRLPVKARRRARATDADPRSSGDVHSSRHPP
jgi:hypothetical protein